MNRSLCIAFDEDDDSEWTKTDRSNQPIVDFSFDEPSRSSHLEDSYDDGTKVFDTKPQDLKVNNEISKKPEDLFSPLPSSSTESTFKHTEPGRLSPAPSISSSSSVHNLSSTSAAPSRSADYDRLMKQHTKLKNAYELLRGERYRPPPIKESISRLMNGRSANLYAYRSRTDKEKLLHEATTLGEGDTILTIVLYLKSTLNESIFRQILQTNESALNHYVAYIKEICSIHDASQILCSFGRQNEASALELESCFSKIDNQSRLNSVKRLIDSQVGTGDAENQRYCDYIAQYADLLQRQIVVDKHDDEMQLRGNEKFLRYPKKASVIGQSPLTTLFYSALYHFDAHEQDQASPIALRKTHQFTNAQYDFTLIKALAKQERWPDIDNQMTKKSIIGLTKLKMPINAKAVVGMLAQYKAPSDLLAKYLPYVSDVNERLQTAKDVQCSQIVVDCYVALKDRQALLQYLSTLQQKTAPAIYAEKALNNASTKWKN